MELKQRLFSKSTTLYWAGPCLLILAVMAYGYWLEPFWIRTTHVTIPDARLSRILKDKTVIQLSDLHIEGIGRREKAVLRILQDLRPDILLLTGDYVPWKGDYRPALDFLSRLRAGTGIWAVMGDHDYSNDRQSCLFCHEPGTGNPTRRHPVRFLRNSHDTIAINGATLCLYGMDSGDMDQITEKAGATWVGDNHPLIGLAHDPLLFDTVHDDSDMVLLAGDTHGGQIGFLNGLAGFLGYEKNDRYHYGLFRHGKKQLFVSRGIGTSHVPIRLLCRPEIVVLHFVDPAEPGTTPGGR
ncbi:MAG: metallophosphoesterase [Thermodesulfobacteriota bacterium]